MQLLKPLTEEKHNSALRSFSYSEDKLKEDTVQLKDWLLKQHHLPPSRVKESDIFLKFFITGTKGDLEKTKSKLDSYYTYRSKSEVLASRDPLSNENVIVNRSKYAILPNSTSEGFRVLFGCLEDLDLSDFNVAAHLRKLVTLIDLQSRMESYSIGHFIVLDAINFRFSHTLKLRPAIVREAIRIAQDILPIRIKGIFLINAPYIIEKAFNTLVIPFMPTKLKNRIHITSGNNDELATFIDRSILPMDYGGEEQSLQDLTHSWIEKEMLEREWFRNEMNELVDETKRSKEEDKINTASFSGISFSFKKLFYNTNPERRKI